jgi:hypothetical protein
MIRFVSIEFFHSNPTFAPIVVLRWIVKKINLRVQLIQHFQNAILFIIIFIFGCSVFNFLFGVSLIVYEDNVMYIVSIGIKFHKVSGKYIGK